MAGDIRELNDSDFQGQIKNGVTMVDFWAPWCPPCRTQGPIVEKVAASFAGKAAIAKLNVDENGAIAKQYTVQNIPTIIVFKDGKEEKRLVGLQPEASLASAINDLL